MTHQQRSHSDEIAEWLERFAEDEAGVLMADGFEDAFLGVAVRCSQPPLAVYDGRRCIEIIMERDGASEEDATECFEFNTVGAWAGERTPLYLWRYRRDDPDTKGGTEK
jgi:hypothetical protein